MSGSKATRSTIDTHRHISGSKQKQKFVESMGFDDKSRGTGEWRRDALLSRSGGR